MGRSKAKQTSGCQKTQRMPVGSTQFETRVSTLESELRQEKDALESINELYLRKEEKLDSVVKECAYWKDESVSWKRVSNMMKSDRAQFKDQRDQLQAQVEQVIKECAQWKEESASWKKISNEMTCERAKFKDQRDQLQTQVADLEKQLQFKVRDVAEKKTELDKLNEIAKESVAQWYWTGNDDEAHAFDMAANPQIEQAYQSNGGLGTMKLQSGIYIYDVNFDTMTQTNAKSGRQRGIHRHVFGAHSADPVGVVKLALMARSQEAEMARLQRARAVKEHEELAHAHAATQEEMADMRMVVENMRAELLARQTSKEMVEKHLAESQRRLQKHTGTVVRAKKEAETLKADVKNMQCKDQGARKLIDELRCDLCKATEEAQRARSESERREHDLQRLQEHCKDIEDQMRAQASSKQRVVQELNALLLADRDSGSITDAKARSIAELWKAPVAPGVFEKMQESSSTVDKIESLFKQHSHQNPFFPGPHGPVSRCSTFQQLKVHAVYSLHNPRLWRKYSARKEDLRCMHSESKIIPGAVDPCVRSLTSLINGLKLDTSLNEVLLGTGCSEKAASAIVKDGFDIRFTGTNGGSMYGEGLYFSHEMCKCNQYTDAQGPSHLRHLIIARVTLGDPCFLTGPKHQERLPPLRAGEESRYDSSVVNPRLSQSGQAHWEYVIFDGAQACPELLVTYETP